MAHWAELDENNVVLRVTVGNNNDPDEGYQWLIDNLGGTWLKCSYNTRHGSHLLGGDPYRLNYPGIGWSYRPDLDGFVEPQPYPSWVLDEATGAWNPPYPMPEEPGIWTWDEDSTSWVS